jgi:Fungal trichothecene efflux pump (TRI12)
MAAQLYSVSSTWRWGAWINIILNGGTFGMLLLFYWPPPRPNSQGLTKIEILKRIDYLGAFLSVGGVALFLLGILWGGYQ